MEHLRCNINFIFKKIEVWLCRKFFFCKVMSAWTVLLFYPNHFYCCYCHMFIAIRVTPELKSPATGIVLRILYTLMFAAIAERPGVQGWPLKATVSRRTRQLMDNHLYFYLQPYFALSRHSQSNKHCGKTSQHHLASLISLPFLVCNY